MQPGRFTELFFLDEATAFAADHRPCALCRREDYNHFAAVWQKLHPGEAGADAIDARLHGERVDPRTRAQLRHEVPFDELPDGTFVLHEGDAKLVLGNRLLRWTASGYRSPSSRPERSNAVVLTPPSLVALLRTGWRPCVPLLHPSVRMVWS
jgi:hypothetical protein